MKSAHPKMNELKFAQECNDTNLKTKIWQHTMMLVTHYEIDAHYDAA